MGGWPPSFKAPNAAFDMELRRLTGMEPVAIACSITATLAAGENVELFLLLTRCVGPVDPAENVWEWERL